MATAESGLVGAEWVQRGFMTSSVGRKVVMALTGTILFGFVTVHMLGNLQVYLGPTAFNAYAEMLREMLHGGGIWIARSALLVAALLHAWTALSLTLSNRQARPVGYRAHQHPPGTWVSRLMPWTGLGLLAFIVYHLLHLTTGQAHPDFMPGDAYHNFVTGFRVPLASALYIAAQLCLGLHLWHGVWSLTQTLGLSHPRYEKLRRRLASAFAILVAAINISFPLAVLAGLI
jgi:succinate dehydrogenase / fumarate reductase cytochrome b subunit